MMARIKSIVRCFGVPLSLLVAAFLLSAPAAALEEIAVGADSGERGPTPAERLKEVRAEQKDVAQRADELAAREAELEQEVERARQEALVACPPLIRIKYPWLTCSTNAWGVKSLDPSGGDSLGPVSRLLLGNAGPRAGEALWGLDVKLLY